MKTLILLACVAFAEGGATPPDERFIDGYVRSAIEREIELAPESFDVTVTGRDVIVWLDDATPETVARVKDLLATLRGVGKAEVRDRAKARPGDLPSEPTSAGARISTEPEILLPPSRHLFQPLLADPKEPAFFASWRRYEFEDEGSRIDVVAVGMGAAIPLWRNDPEKAHQFQLAIDAGVFSEFNMDDKANLLNADYLVGLPFQWRHEAFSAKARFYHQSSHLGDETLVENMRERFDLSYESIELLLSYELAFLRGYGGGEYIVRRTPDDLDQKIFHWGVEAKTPSKVFDAFRLAAGVDVKHYQEFGYNPDVSVRAGFVFGDVTNEISLLFEYFNGHAPHGQFLLQEVDFYGLGLYYRF